MSSLDDDPRTTRGAARMLFHLLANALHDIASAIDPWDRSKR